MKPCLFSVSYAGFWGQARLSLTDFIAKAAQTGYEAVMLAGKRPHLSPLDMDDERTADLKAVLDRHGVSCPIIAAYTDLKPDVSEIPYGEMQIACVESLARIGARLGASVVRVFTAYESSGSSPLQTWQNVVTVLREMCDRAAAYGITIAVQNHHDTAVHSDALLDLLADIDHPACRLGFDAWSPALRGEDLYETARRMAPYTIMTTNADYVRFPRYRYEPDLVNYMRTQPDLVRAVPFGEGFIDFEAFFAGLREGGFRGFASYEICSPVRGGGSMDNLDACARRYLEWMTQRNPA